LHQVTHSKLIERVSRLVAESPPAVVNQATYACLLLEIGDGDGAAREFLELAASPGASEVWLELAAGSMALRPGAGP
jgi:hypothetical protein